MKKKIKNLSIIIILILILILTLTYFIIRNSKSNCEIKELNFKNIETRKIEIGIPKYSFLLKNNDRSYSFKNIKKSSNLKLEIQEYLQTLEKINCNDTAYYYNKENNYTLLEYKIKNKLIYNTISYELYDGNYCEDLKIEEYNKYIKIGNSYRMGPQVSFKEENIGKFVVEVFPQTLIVDNKFQMMMSALIIEKDKANIIELSKGTYEIKDGKLIYKREEIEYAIDKNIIPEYSIFKIENNKLILEENYLNKYSKKIELEYAN